MQILLIILLLLLLLLLLLFLLFLVVFLLRLLRPCLRIRLLFLARKLGRGVNVLASNKSSNAGKQAGVSTAKLSLSRKNFKSFSDRTERISSNLTMCSRTKFSCAPLIVCRSHTREPSRSPATLFQAEHKQRSQDRKGIVGERVHFFCGKKRQMGCHNLNNSGIHFLGSNTSKCKRSFREAPAGACLMALSTQNCDGT